MKTISSIRLGISNAAASQPSARSGRSERFVGPAGLLLALVGTGGEVGGETEPSLFAFSVGTSH